MSDKLAEVADALAQAFKARVAQKVGMRFEDTGVSLPPRELWEYYGRAVLQVLEPAL